MIVPLCLLTDPMVAFANVLFLYISSDQRNLISQLQISLLSTCLTLTCSTNHPIIQSGKIRYELLEKYPAFTSIPASNSDNYAPAFLSKYGITIKNAIVMDPSDVRYRLLQKMNGFLVSIPISDVIKAKYDLTSLPVKNSRIIIFALCRKNSQKEELLNEYIQYCKELFTESKM